MKRALPLCLAAGLALAFAVGVTAASAAPKQVDVGVIHAPDVVEKGTLPIATSSPASIPSQTNGIRTLGRAATAQAEAQIGDQKTFLILDDAFGIYRLANFTLKSVG